jgi:putative CocE/NonD family hydrolase
LYFHPQQALIAARPGGDHSLAYLFDPKDPVPTVGGYQLTIPAGPKDQRAVEKRNDVLVFSSEPLRAPLEVTGRVRVKLYVSSDASDTDFLARLCDVYPDGRSFNICEGIVRARYRRSFDHETSMKPRKIYPIDIDLWSTSIIFNQGHSLRVHVTSSSAPAYDPNPNTGEPFRSSDRMRPARNTIHLSKAYPSHIVLPVVQGSASP